MRYALVGCDRESVELVTALARVDNARVVSGHLCGSQAEMLRELLPGIALSDTWEELLGGPPLDGIIVSRDRGETWRGAALRQLTRAGARLVLVHPACDAALAWELDAIRIDARAQLLAHAPLFPAELRGHLRRWLAAGEHSPIGACRQLLIEAPLAEPTSQQVRARCARDALHAAQWLGPVTRVDAHGELLGADRWERLSAELETADGCLIRWLVVPPAGPRSGVWTLLGTKGRIVITLSDDAARRRWSITGDAESLAGAGESDEADEAIGWLLDHARCETAPPLWSDVARSLDVAESVARSARAARPVELAVGSAGQERSLKVLVATGLCLVLLALVAVLVFGVIWEILRGGPGAPR